MNHEQRLIVALDTKSYDDAARLVEQLSPRVAWFKIGSQLFTGEGARVCRLVKDANARLFLDLKYHDIPNTVYGAVESAMGLGCDMLTLHASGGPDMLRSAREAATAAGRPDAILLAVTVLTSFDAQAFASMFGSTRGGADMVTSFAVMAREAGMSGVVASAHELRAIKTRVGEDFVVVTPGIRPGPAAGDDQIRVVTPEAAIRDGADYIVVGRPIIAAPDPAAAADEILARIAPG